MNATQLILSEINSSNVETLQLPLTTENVILGNVQILGSMENLVNTTCRVNPIVGKGFTSGVAIAWHRLRLDRLFYGIPVVIVDADALTTKQLVPLINAMYGTDIEPDDIVNASLPSTPSQSTVNITSASSSLRCCGSFALKFSRAT